jgi:hypothetical protein
MSPNYQNAKIYKLYSYENDDVYYGSTVEKLSQRFSHHISDFKKYKEGKKNYITCFEILQLKSVMIELVELCPCNTKEELLQREGYYIRNNKCVNKFIPDRKQKEYKEQNNEHIKEYIKEWKEHNKEHIKTQSEEYYQQNREQILKKKKQYYQQNKDKINKQQRDKRLLKKANANKEDA